MGQPLWQPAAGIPGGAGQGHGAKGEHRAETAEQSLRLAAAKGFVWHTGEFYLHAGYEAPT